MSVKYVSVPHGDLGSGIDQLSAEDSITEGYSELLVNFDPIPEGYVSKRPGYQGAFGGMPVRVKEVVYTASNTAELVLDGSIDMTRIPSPTHSRPIVAYGRTSAQNVNGAGLLGTWNAATNTPTLTDGTGTNGTYYQVTVGGTQNLGSGSHTYVVGEWVYHAGGTWAPSVSNPAGDFPTNTDACHYYSTFSADPRYSVPTGTHTFPLTPDIFGLTTQQAFIGMLQSTSATANDWEQLLPDSVSILSNLELDVITTNTTNSAFSAFIYSLTLPTVAGTTWVSDGLGGRPGPYSVAAGVQTISIPVGTHNLGSVAIQLRTYSYNGGTGAWAEVNPDSTVIDTAGNITITINNQSGGTLSIIVLATETPLLQTKQGSVGANSTGTIVIPNVTSPFLFADAYVEQSVGGPRERVLPHTVTYSSSTNAVTVTFINNSNTAQSFYVYWQYGQVSASTLTVTTANSVATTFTDTSPQISIWGLDHSQIYGSTAGSHAGWVTELDTYRSTGEQFLVAGLGGNLFSGAAASSATAAAYLLPTLYPNARARVNGSVNIGPCFLKTGTTPYRTAGHVVADNVTAAGTLQASSITFDPITTLMKVQIPLVNGTTTGGSSIINTVGFADKLTITGASHAIQNGTFDIVLYSVTPALLTLTVQNNAVANADWDDPSSGATVAIYTDRIPFTGTSPFLSGDQLLSDAILATQTVAVLASSASTALVGGITSEVAFPGSTRVVGRRTSNVIPLRDLTDTATVADLVCGDMLSMTGLARQLRVLNVQVLPDTSLTLSTLGTTVTATLGAGNTNSIAIGDSVNLLQAGQYSGTQVVTSVLSSTQFTFTVPAPSGSVPSTGTLQGATVTVDESITWNDDPVSAVTISVPGRWLPLEAPSTAATETPAPYVTHFSASTYTSQPIVRSTMVNDSLIMNNGTDRTLKCDGANVYRAGLPRWQPHLFAAVASGATGTITLDTVSCTTIAENATIGGQTPGAWTQYSNKFNVNPQDVNTFQVGTQIQVSGGTGTTYTVTSAETQTLGAGTSQQALGVITVSSPLNGIQEAAPSGSSTGTLQQVAKRSYYFRLNAVDANRNVVASAAVGSEDWTIIIPTSSAVRIRLVGLPAWDIYDYDRLEVQVYGTKLTGAAPYYLLTTIPMSFNAGGGYIDFVDTFSDDTLTNLDAVNTALKGQELGTGWSHPVRAQHVTSSSNKLVLANLSSDPFIDVTLSNPGVPITSASFANLKWLLRKDETDGQLTTNMVSRVNYQWLTSGDVAVSGISVGSGQFTITSSIGNSVTAGNWVYLFRKAAPGTDQQTHFMGWWQVASATATTVTFNWPGATGLSITLSKEIDRAVIASTPADVPVWLGTDYNYQTTSATLGQDGVSPAEGMAAIRMANAVNATQRVVDRTLTGMSAFRPWVCCDAGGEFQSGEFIFRQVQNSSTIFQLTLPAAYSGFNVYLDNVKFAAGSSFGAVVQRKPSRLLVSYPNFAEIFDSPFAQVDSQSDSAIDVNPSDGQEITAVIPFYGDSSFGAAMKDSVILVFKTNSIYLVNLAQKAAGANCVQRLESMGLGCTAPYSVTPTRNGIMFANESGLYRLDQSMTIYYLGRHIQRLWRQGTNLTSSGLSLMFGTNYAANSQFKLSVPTLGSNVPNAAYVYNSTREYSMQGITNTVQLYATREGSWAQHSGFSAIGWCNLGADNFYAGLNGRVMQLRRTGLPQDYRDDASAIAATATLRSIDFGDDGVRKTVPYALVSFRNPPNLGARTGTQVASQTDLFQTFTPADSTTLPNNASSAEQEGLTYRYSFGTKRGVRFQLRITNSTKDEPVDITRIRYVVGGLTPAKGVREAASGPAPARTS